jgi:hypothetical protein
MLYFIPLYLIAAIHEEFQLITALSAWGTIGHSHYLQITYIFKCEILCRLAECRLLSIPPVRLDVACRSPLRNFAKKTFMLSNLTDLLINLSNNVSRLLMAGLLPWRPGFSAGSFHMEFVIEKVWQWDFFSQFLGFTLSLSFYRGSILMYHVED